MLAEVRSTWLRVRAVDAELSSILPGTNGACETVIPFGGELPQIPGYEMQRVLGRGGVAIVYLAHHVRLGRSVAVKMLLAGPQAKIRELERFSREAKTLAELHHPNIIQIFDVGDYKGCPYFTMEYLNGGSLSDRVKERPMPAKDAARMIGTLADAIHAAHQSGIIHRDLTPSNILFTTDGLPKITDFGLARHMDGNTGGLTLMGAAVGTPGYMAPEQADGRGTKTGPAKDVYALGAILFKLLAGRPPFQAETTASTIRHLLFDDPVSPAKLNPSVPRDLETICLKCLSKEPQKRYESAAALADDVRRFERGEPIHARPIGHFGRTVRWARRRPALAGAIAFSVLLTFALIATILWWHHQQTALQATAIAYAEADLLEAARKRDRGEYDASAAVLQRARDRLRVFVPPELSQRLSTAFNNLQLVTRLDAIRLERALAKPPTDVVGVLVTPATAVRRGGEGLPDDTSSSQHYEQTFREAGIGSPGRNSAEAAEHVRESPVRDLLVAALDDWSACTTDADQQKWILAVVRQADPDPWRDRVRDPATWNDAESLRDIAARAPTGGPSPQLLVVLGARLRANNIDAVPFFVRVAAAYPNDLWANIEAGNTFLQQSNSLEAAGYYRAALALRPKTASLHYALGGMYLNLHRWDECIAEYEQAIRLDSANAWCYNRLGVALQWMGEHDDEAIAKFRESIRIDPNIGWTHHHLAVSLERKGHFDEAVAEFCEAIRLFPNKRVEWKWDLRRVLMRQGRGADVRAAWKEELAPRPTTYYDWDGYAELCLFLGDNAEYRRACRELLTQFGTARDPVVAERVGRVCLLLPGTQDELREAVALTDRAVVTEGPQYDGFRPYFNFAKGLAHYRSGRFDDAITTMTGEASKAAEYMGPSPRLVLAMALYQKGQKDDARKLLAAALQSYDWSAENTTTREAWIAHVLRREADSLISKDLPASLDNK
jgi:serine/threonine-protein kinase